MVGREEDEDATGHNVAQLHLRTSTTLKRTPMLTSMTTSMTTPMTTPMATPMTTSIATSTTMPMRPAYEYEAEVLLELHGFGVLVARRDRVS